MRSGGNDFYYFKLIKWANFVQFKRMLVLSGGLGAWASLGYATGSQHASLHVFATKACLKACTERRK